MPVTTIKQILLLLDNRFDENWGSQATTNELVRGVQATYPDATISGIRRTEIRTPKWAFSIGYRWAPKGPITEWRDPLAKFGVRLLMKGWEDAVASADLVVVNGEGTLHPQPQTFAWLSIIDRIIESQMCPVWVVNCSISLGDGSMDSLLDHVLHKVDRLVVREPYSYRLALERGWKAELGADCAFLSNSTSGENIDTWLKDHKIEGAYAVITGGANSGSWDISNATQWINAIRELGLNIVFCASTGTDRSLYRALALDCPLFSSEHFDYKAAINLIQKSSLHVGGRFHPTIFAACSGTTFVCINGNTHKMSGLMEMLNTPHLLYEHTKTEGISSAILSSKTDQKDQRMIEHCDALGVSAQSNFRAQP